jgi:hypothetical protein
MHSSVRQMYAYSVLMMMFTCVLPHSMKDAGWSEAKQRSKQAIELNNGRAAQMGILGLMVHEKLNNDPYVLNAMLGSPVPFN